MKRATVLLAAVGALLVATPAWSGASPAGVHLVTPGGSIQAAIDKAGPGDTVFVAPGVYHENVLLEKDGLNLVGFGAHLRPPAQNALSPCADPNHPEETIGICIFGPFFAGALTSDVGVAGFTVSGFDVGFAAVGADDATFAWNRAVDNPVIGFIGVFSPGLRVVGNVARGSHLAGIFMLEQHEGSFVGANRVRDNAVGILVELSDGAVVRGNRLRHNELDLSWDGLGSGNVFAGNSCETSAPPGLCDEAADKGGDD